MVKAVKILLVIVMTICIALSAAIVFSVKNVSAGGNLTGMWEFFDDGTKKCMGDGTECELLSSSSKEWR